MDIDCFGCFGGKINYLFFSKGFLVINMYYYRLVVVKIGYFYFSIEG